MRPGFFEYSNTASHAPTITMPSAITAIAISPCGQFIAAACANHKYISIWDSVTSGHLSSSPSHGDVDINAIAFSPDSKQVSMNGLKREAVRIYDIASGNLHITMDDAGKPIFSLAFLNNGNVVTAAANGKLTLWDSQTRQCIRTLQSPSRNIWFETCIQRVENHFFSTTLDCKIQAFDIHTGEYRWALETPDNRTTAMTITADGKYFIAGGGGYFTIWDLETKGLLKRSRGYDSYFVESDDNLWIKEVNILGIVISENNTHFISIVNHKTLKLWEIATGNLISEKTLPSKPTAFCSLHGNIVIGFEDGSIQHFSTSSFVNSLSHDEQPFLRI